MVLLSQSQLERLISESMASVIRKRFMLNESHESKSIIEAVRLYMERTGKSREEAEEFIRITLRSSVPALRDKQTAKFILGVTRMALDGQLRDATTISNLNSTLKYVGDPTHINEYDRNLNGLSAEELIGRFAIVRSQDMEKDKADIDKSQFQEKKEYKVIRIDSFEQIRQYGKYNDWCLAQDNGRGMYYTYTSDGVNQLYLILRDGFENEPRKAGPNTPYDSYGLSMMTVIVDPDGQMTQSTTRWNHENGSSDSAFTPKQISEIIGRNFYDVFKPNTKFKDTVEDALRRVRNGEDLEDIFDNVDEPSEGMIMVELMSKKNYLTPDKTFLLSQWADEIRYFNEGFASFKIEGKGWNYVNTDGEMLTKDWFKYASFFTEGFGCVGVEGKGYNFINTKGEILFKNWFDGTSFFHNGFCLVIIDKKGYNFINRNGDFISEIWFDSAADEFYEGFAGVFLKEKGYNFINTSGEIVSEVWFDAVENFQNGFAKIYITGKGWNFINKKGDIISNRYFRFTGKFRENGRAPVVIDGEPYLIDGSGNIISRK